MKSAALIASIATSTNAGKPEDCCVSKKEVVVGVGVGAGLPTGASTTTADLPGIDKAWICTDLRKAYNMNLQQCKVDVKGYFEDLPGYPVSRHNVNIKNLERRTDKAFHKYCGLDTNNY